MGSKIISLSIYFRSMFYTLRKNPRVKISRDDMRGFFFWGGDFVRYIYSTDWLTMFSILNENFTCSGRQGKFKLLRMERLTGILNCTTHSCANVSSLHFSLAFLSSVRVSFENSHTMPVVNLNGFDSSFSRCFVSCTVPVHCPSFGVLGCGDCSNYMQSSQ